MNRFPKAEHLCSQRLIDRLFAEGHRLVLWPYSIHWIEVPDLPVACQVLIVVPKRKLHRAVDRNRMRRLTRECYRLHKDMLLPMLGRQEKRIALALVYTSTAPLDWDRLRPRFDRLTEVLEKNILTHESPAASVDEID